MPIYGSLYIKVSLILKNLKIWPGCCPKFFLIICMWNQFLMKRILGQFWYRHVIWGLLVFLPTKYEFILSWNCLLCRTLSTKWKLVKLSMYFRILFTICIVLKCGSIGEFSLDILCRSLLSLRIRVRRFDYKVRLSSSARKGCDFGSWYILRRLVHDLRSAS